MSPCNILLRHVIRSNYFNFLKCNRNIKYKNSFNIVLNITRRYFSKYRVFKDEDSSFIFDVEEERLKKAEVNVSNKSSSNCLEIPKIENGVFGIQDIVELVKVNNGKKLFVVKIPTELNYVEFMVIVSGTSRRHIDALAAIIRKQFKLRKNTNFIPKIEGTNSDWVALDLGNIVIHIMMDSVRKIYDLESLWAIGTKYDIKLNTEDNEVLKLLKYSKLDDLYPVAAEKT